VLTFEGDRHHSLRFLTSSKHRFGAAGELGLFEMGENGLQALADPSAVLLADRRRGAAGAAVAPVIEGRRPLLVEVQALVSASRSTGRRVVQGILPSRLSLLLAVLERSAGIATGGSDVFVSTVGAIKVGEPAADLAVSLAVASALTAIPLPDDAVFFGEVGLGGEIRQVASAKRRVTEAERLGFRWAYGPSSPPAPSRRIEVLQVATLGELVSRLGFTDPQRLAEARSGTSSVRRSRTAGSSRPRSKTPLGRSGLRLVRD
jgi:DNA repair protein RadA/Sms